MRTMIAAMLVLFCTSAYADDPAFDPAEASFSNLLRYASTYATTDQKRADKQAAKDELMARGPDSLRYLAGLAHIRNIWPFVYAHQLVRSLDAEEAMPVLMEALDGTNTYHRSWAVFLMGEYTNAPACDRILPLLAEDVLFNSAARTLGKWQCGEAVPLIETGLSSTNERTRIIAVNALADIGNRSSVPVLVAMLSDEVFTVRYAAQYALVRLDAAGDALETAAEFPDAVSPPAWRHLIRVWGAVRDPATRHHVEALFEHEEESVRGDARRALDGAFALYGIHRKE